MQSPGATLAGVGEVARKAQTLEHGGHVLLIAADAVKRLGPHYVEAAHLCVGQKVLDAGADHGSNLPVYRFFKSLMSANRCSGSVGDD